MYNDWDLCSKFYSMGHDNNDVRTTKRDPRNTSALGRSKLRSYFSSIVDQSSPNLSYACAGEIAVCNAGFRSTMSVSSRDICDHVEKLFKICPIFWFSWAANFFGGRDLKLRNFLNSAQHRTSVKIWWRATERLRRLDAAKKRKQSTTAQNQKSPRCSIADTQL